MICDIMANQTISSIRKYQTSGFVHIGRLKKEYLPLTSSLDLK